MSALEVWSLGRGVEAYSEKEGQKLPPGDQSPFLRPPASQQGRFRWRKGIFYERNPKNSSTGPIPDSNTLVLGLGTPIHHVYGPKRIENITNALRLDRYSTSFGTQLRVHAFLQATSADYTIELYDTNMFLLKTTTGHAETGVIDEVWNVGTAGGILCYDEGIEARIYVTPTARTTNGIIVPIGPTTRIPVWYHNNNQRP